MIKTNELNVTLKSILLEHSFPGAAVVYGDSEVNLLTTSGHIDESREIHYQDTTLFRIGCFTKVLTAFQIMRLKDEGLIAVDKALVTYLPEFNKLRSLRFDQITIRNLLTHECGLGVGSYLNDQELTTNNVFEALSQWDDSERFIYEPGKQCSYASVGYVLLSYLIERIRNKSWENDLNESILKPLDIVCAQLPGSPIYPSYADGGRIISDGPPVILTQTPIAILPAIGGSLALTIKDLGKLAAMYINDGVACNGDKILSLSSIEEMYNYSALPSGPWAGLRGLGYGWLLYDDDSIGFTGDGLGNHVMIRLDRKRRLFLAVATNYHSATPLFSSIWERVVAREKQPNNGPLTATDHISIDDLLGTYRTGGYGIISIENENDSLMMKFHGGGTPHSFELIHIFNRQYFAPTLHKFNNIWFLSLNNDNKVNYIWNGVCLAKKIS